MAEMQGRVEQIRERMMRCLDDQQTTVIDIPKFEECLSDLEKLSLNQDILMKTSIGKSVNELRRSLANKHAKLSKRLKSLVKKWHDLVNAAMSSAPAISPSPSLPTPLSSQSSPSLQKINGVGSHATSPAPRTPVKAVPTPPMVPTASPGLKTGGIKLKLPNPKRGAKPDVEVPVPASPSNKKLRSVSSLDGHSSSPFLPSADSNSSHADGIFDSAVRDGSDSNSALSNVEVKSAVPARLKPRRIEKVKSHSELLADLRKENPVAVSHIDLPPLQSCDESLKSSSPVIAQSTKDGSRKRKDMDGKSEKGKDSDGSMAQPARKKPSYPPGRGPDPVDAEIARILEDLPPLLPEGHVDSAASEGVAPEGRKLTEVFFDKTRTGDKVVVLPYVYFPFTSE